MDSPWRFGGIQWRLKWLRTPGQITGIFIAGYGASRFIVEFFRQADAQLITPDNPFGYIVSFGDWGVSMGHSLSIPMILLGLGILFLARRRISSSKINAQNTAP